jgi:hypothetical protein
MKATLSTLACWAAAGLGVLALTGLNSVAAPGTVAFFNHNGSRITNGVGGAPITTNANVRAALYWAPIGSSNFVQLGAAATVGVPVPGVFVGGTRTCGAGTPGGTVGQFRVRAWSGSATNYETARMTSGVLIGQSAIIQINTGDPAGDPPTAPTSLLAGGFSSFALLTNTATPLVVICSTNKTVGSGTTWNFDEPLVSGGCSSNPTVVVQSTVTNGFNPNLITRTWWIYDECITNTCSQTVSVLDATPPSIVSQPESVTNNAGSNAVFSVTATGAAPLSYQWRKDGLPLIETWQISGATSNILTLSNLHTSLAGSYDVIVSNSVDSVTSSVAILFIICPNITVSGTLSPTLLVGQHVGTNYYFDAFSEAGPVSLTFSITNLPPGLLPGLQSGNTLPIYGAPTTPGTNVVTVTAQDMLTGCSGFLIYTQVVECPEFTFSPASLTNGSLTSVYEQTLTVTYPWQSGFDTLLYGVVSGTLPPGVALSTNGSFYGIPTALGSYNFTVGATNQYGCTGTRAYTVDILAPPSVDPPPAASLVYGLSGFSLSMPATGSEPLTYQWRWNGNDISGANSPTFTLPQGTVTNAGNYDVVISNPYGSVTSSVVAASFFGDLRFYAAPTLAGGVGSSYRVDYADVIGGVTNAWQVLTNITLPHSPYLVIDPGSPGQNQRFYRAVPLP